MNNHWIASGREEFPDLEVLEESALAMAQATIQNAMDEASISKAVLARSMDRPRSFITRMLSGHHNLTVKTMARSLLACGYQIEFGVAPIVWNWPASDAMEIEFNEVPSSEGTLLLANLSAGSRVPSEDWYDIKGCSFG